MKCRYNGSARVTLLNGFVIFLIIAVIVTVEPKEKKCLSKPAVCASAVFIGIMLVAIAIVSVYAAGEFDSSSELPEIMEGEVTFTSEDGKGEDFHVVIDFKRKLVQLSSLDIKAFPVMEESRKINGTGFTAAKTVIQDYNTVSLSIIMNNSEQNLFSGTKFFAIKHNVLAL